MGRTHTATVRDAFSRMINKYDKDKIDALIFTSFGFDTQFFEDNILGLLAETQGRLATRDDIYAATELANKYNLSVFYDAYEATIYDKKVTYNTLPIHLEDRVFHPKVIIVSGEINGSDRLTCMLITSANLTVSGWGLNREVVSTIEVKDSGVAEPLQRFLHWLFEKATVDPNSNPISGIYSDLMAHLEVLASKGITTDSPLLHVTLPEEKSTLIQTLREREYSNLQIFSPYFIENPTDYFKKVLPATTIELIPALDRDDRILMLNSAIEDIQKSEQLTLKQIKDESTEKRYRFNHFKLYQNDDGIILGSHNCTEAALGSHHTANRLNVEVSLELPLHDKGEQPELLPLDETVTGYDHREDLKREDERNNRDAVNVVVYVDWSKGKYIIHNENEKRARIHLPGQQTSIISERTAAIPLSRKARTALITNKRFSVHDLNSGKVIYRGFINELQWQDYRQEEILTSINDYLDAWVSDSPERFHAGDRIRAYDAFMQDNTEENYPDLEIDISRIIDLEDSKGSDVLDNYFQLYSAMNRMYLKIENLVETEDKEKQERMLPRYLIKYPSSPVHIVQLVLREWDRRDEFEHLSIYQYFLLLELKELLTRLQRKTQSFRTVQKHLQEIEEELNEFLERVSIPRSLEELMHKAENAKEVQFILKELGYDTLI